MLTNSSFVFGGGNLTIPFSDVVLGPCDASVAQAYYQGLLTQWWGAFLLGGFVLGFLACYIAMGWITRKYQTE